MISTSDLRAIVRKAVEPIAVRTLLGVSRAIIKLVDDDKKLQSLQVGTLADEVRDDVERMQEYGFTSVPDADAEALVVAVGGDRSHLVCVATDDRRTRPTGMKRGEVALWTLQHGRRVHLADDGMVYLGTEPTNFVALANLVLDELHKIKDAFSEHTHEFSGTTSSSCSAGGSTGSCSGTTSSGPIYTPGDVAATEVKAK